MPMSKIGYIQRYLLIIRLIKANPYIDMETLLSRINAEIGIYDILNIGSSERTIRRDLKDIRSYLGISIDYSKVNNGYYIPQDEDQQSDIERVLEPFDLLGSLYTGKKLPGFVFTEKRKAKGTEHLFYLIKAIKDSFIIEFLYLKFDNTLSYTRKVEPYALKEFKGRWYLLAIEIGGKLEERGEIKTWGLDRIQSLIVTNNRFFKIPQLNIEDEFESSFGIYADKEKSVEEVILSFAPIGGRYNDAFPLHHSQKVLVNTDKEFRVSLNVRITYDFIMELLSQSEGMQVIKPQHLKTTLINIHKKAINTLQKVD